MKNSAYVENFLSKLPQNSGYEKLILIADIFTEYFAMKIYQDAKNQNDLIVFVYWAAIGNEKVDEYDFMNNEATEWFYTVYFSFRVKPLFLIRYLYGNFGLMLLLLLHRQKNALLHKIPYIKGVRQSLFDDGIINYRINKRFLYEHYSLGTTEFRDLEGDDKQAIQSAIDLISEKFNVKFAYQPDYQYDYSGLGLRETPAKILFIPCFFKELESIDYSRNKIKKLPEWFNHWKLTRSLEKVDFTHNPISDTDKYNFLLDLELGGWSKESIDKIII